MPAISKLLRLLLAVAVVLWFALVTLVIAGLLILGGYTLIDWGFALIVLPVGFGLAFLVTSAINWWGEHH